MILRDPVHGLVEFEGVAERVVSKLLATREVQRLRRICQLGLTSLVFPGAEHSRFTHSLGAAHVMVRLLERIRVKQSEMPRDQRVDEEAEADVLAASLLHDLGHGPFSHLFEEVLPHASSHEAWTARIIRDPATDVYRALESISKNMPERVASLLSGRYRLGYLSRAVGGPLDVDRCDYLLRDSHMTGVSYGVYDLNWLLRAFSFAQVSRRDSGPEWVLAIDGRKGLPPIEGFFLARQFMFEQVYHHKATRAAESLIRGIFIRVADLVKEGKLPLPMPRAIQKAVLDEPVSLSDYLMLDDVQLLGCFQAWASCSDRVLSDLTSRLLGRKLPKTVALATSAESRLKWRELFERACEIANHYGFIAGVTVWLDLPFEIPYIERDDDSLEGLWVVIRSQSIRRLGDVSFMLGELRNKRIDRPRLIFPPEIREEVLEAVEKRM
ncbi:MAG: HD domain-containing protein [Deltaproteobacteria bacterium]|nr:HD domain-containing protein [Deltaproteobacteria bacterium]